MDNIILHISDLHISDNTDKFGKGNPYTYLTTSVTNKNYDFINHFIDKVKSFSSKNIYIIITGDIADIGESSEYEEGIKLLKHLVSEIKISSSNILLIPGDHDVHRDTVKNELRKPENSSKEGRSFQREKFINFNKLYTEIKKTEFNSELLIFDKIIMNQIILLAVNSNFNVNQFGGHGFMPSELLDKELKVIREEYKSYEILICLHHNLQGEHEDKISGQWNAENRRDLITVFQRYNIKCIFNGNEHTPNSKSLGSSNIVISDSGPLTSNNKPSASFKVYEIVEDKNNLFLKNHLYELRRVAGQNENNFGNWIEIPLDQINGIEIEKFILKEDNTQTLKEPIELPFLKIEEPPAEPTKNVEAKIYENLALQDELYNIVKKKKLFHQGHFHWSETSRAHNWIDISRLLEDKDDLFFVKNSIVDVIENLNLMDNCNLIIGLGYEGNIISSQVSIKYNVPYTFLPYSYRYKDHHEFENKLNFDNSDSDFKKVIIITDVVNDGRTIRKLVGKKEREKAFFDNVGEIIVISLFYTGGAVLNSDILNYDNMPSNYDFENDNEVNNIQFYTIKSLTVEKCPYGADYKTECFIYKDDLNCVHKFYTEE